MVIGQGKRECSFSLGQGRAGGAQAHKNILKFFGRGHGGFTKIFDRRSGGW